MEYNTQRIVRARRSLANEREKLQDELLFNLKLHSSYMSYDFAKFLKKGIILSNSCALGISSLATLVFGADFIKTLNSTTSSEEVLLKGFIIAFVLAADGLFGHNLYNTYNIYKRVKKELEEKNIFSEDDSSSYVEEVVEKSADDYFKTFRIVKALETYINDTQVDLIPENVIELIHNGGPLSQEYISYYLNNAFDLFVEEEKNIPDYSVNKEKAKRISL